MSKQLSQNAIGRMMNPPMSSANMAKMKKQGCPMDSVESVEAWRRAHQNIAQRKPDVKTQTPASTVPAQHATGSPQPPMQNYGRVGGDDFHAMIRANEVRYDGGALGEGFDEARTREKIATANLAEMQEAELRGSLLRSDAVRAAWAAKITGTRDALLQIPSRIAPVLAAETDLVRVTALLEDELRRALAELSAEVTT